MSQQLFTVDAHVLWVPRTGYSSMGVSVGPLTCPASPCAVNQGDKGWHGPTASPVPTLP